MSSEIRWTAYDRPLEPKLVPQLVVGVILGAIGGSFLGCCGFSVMAPGSGSDPGTAALFLGFFLFVLGPVIGAGYQYSRHTQKKKRYEQHLAFQQRYFQGVDDVLRNTVESNGEWLSSQDWSQWYGLYRPKSDDPAIYMAGALMTEQRARVEAVSRVGVVKFAKVPFNSLGYANVEKVIEHKVNYDHVEGRGVLVVTHDCLRFISQGHGMNWSMPWSDVMSWQPAINALLVQPSSGTPKAFIIEGAGFEPMYDTQVVDKALELAHDL